MSPIADTALSAAYMQLLATAQRTNLEDVVNDAVNFLNTDLVFFSSVKDALTLSAVRKPQEVPYLTGIAKDAKVFVAL